jgi:hypothetical protein
MPQPASQPQANWADPRFSPVLLNLQVKINSSSLGPFKKCPRYYQYTIIDQLQSRASSVHLTFGTLIHEAIGAYEAKRLAGADHESALLQVVHSVLLRTWNVKLGRGWQSGHADKNREGLIRTIVWYLDAQRDSALQTLQLPSGPAIELRFEFDSGYTASTGERITFYGTLDRLVEISNRPYILDTKTTGYKVDTGFFNRFSPDNQFSLYILAAKVAFAVPAEGLICDAIQVGATFSRFQRGIIPRTDEQVNEWLHDAHWWLGQMDSCAQKGHWPMNDKSCGLFGGCEFREICGTAPKARGLWLGQSFETKEASGAGGANEPNEFVI